MKNIDWVVRVSKKEQGYYLSVQDSHGKVLAKGAQTSPEVKEILGRISLQPEWFVKQVGTMLSNNGTTIGIDLKFLDLWRNRTTV